LSFAGTARADAPPRRDKMRPLACQPRQRYSS
jgi:hypothetical protein